MNPPTVLAAPTPPVGEVVPETLGGLGASPPAAMRIIRYSAVSGSLRTILGDNDLLLPAAELRRLAETALDRRTFIFHSLPDDSAGVSHELCLVPRRKDCDILVTSTDVALAGRRIENRRSLLEIMNDLATAIACGALRVYDAVEATQKTSLGAHLANVAIEDTASLTRIRETAAEILEDLGEPAARRQGAVLGVSEAATNVLIHGGGHGAAIVRHCRDRIRFIVSDRGHGLDFANWNALGRRVDNAPTMGYGFKIMLNHLDMVGLASGPHGTILFLDYLTRRKALPEC